MTPWLVLVTSLALVSCGAASMAWLRLRAAVGRLDGQQGRAPLHALAAVGRRIERLKVEAGDARRAQAVLEASIESVPLAVVVTDGDGETLFANEDGQRFLAARRADALVWGAIEAVLAGALAGRRGEQVVDTHGPPVRSWHVSATPIWTAELIGESTTRPLGAAIVVEDRSQGARVDRMRQDFVANLGHELRTPIGAISLLIEALEGESTPTVRDRLLARVSMETRRATSIVDDLLELSRLELDPGPPPCSVDVQGLLAEVIDRHTTLAEGRRVTLTADVVDSCTHLVGQRPQLLRALDNLVENAVKYSDDGTEVALAARTVDDYVEFVVRDQGIGIPAHEQERIFERFYRVDRARSRTTGGTGLGLSIVRHVAVNHGGEVSVRSTEGRGSTFVLRIPKEPAL